MERVVKTTTLFLLDQIFQHYLYAICYSADAWLYFRFQIEFVSLGGQNGCRVEAINLQKKI